MKKIIFVLALLLTVSGVIFGITLNANSSKPAPNGEIIRQPIKEGLDRQNAYAASIYFSSCLSTDEDGQLVYPDTYGGQYKDDDGHFVIRVTTSDLSEYLFLQEEFPCIVFEQVKYPYNYLKKLLDEYLRTIDPRTETVNSGRVDILKNRVVIGVDEKTLSQKTNDPDSPIEYELDSGSCELW